MNDSIFYCFEVDDDGRLNNCFWTDKISRKNYHHFSYVLVFVTIYDTNKYYFIFVPFT